jgi:hypothetical protein
MISSMHCTHPRVWNVPHQMDGTDFTSLRPHYTLYASVVLIPTFYSMFVAVSYCYQSFDDRLSVLTLPLCALSPLSTAIGRPRRREIDVLIYNFLSKVLSKVFPTMRIELYTQ